MQIDSQRRQLFDTACPDDWGGPQFPEIQPSRTMQLVRAEWRGEIIGVLAHLVDHVVPVWQKAATLGALEKELLLLKNRVLGLEDAATVKVTICSLAPEPYGLIRPIDIVIRSEGEGFTATFYDANLSASGDTQEEAFMNIKDILIAAYEALSGLKPEQLGPGPARQLAALKDFIRPGE